MAQVTIYLEEGALAAAKAAGKLRRKLQSLGQTMGVLSIYSSSSPTTPVSSLACQICRCKIGMLKLMTSTEISPGLVIQGFVAPLKLSDFKLAAFDMDSTLINIECVDEIADAAGRKAQVAAITEAAMRGEITDYKDSLRRRVALLKGVPVSAMQEVLEQRLQLNPGAQSLTQAL